MKIQKITNHLDWKIKTIISGSLLVHLDDLLMEGYMRICRLKLDGDEELKRLREFNVWFEKKMTKLFK